jgi:hypothetical protein
VGQAARKGKKRVYIAFWWEKLKETSHLQDLRVDGRIILKYILQKYHNKLWIRLLWLRIQICGVLLRK